MVELLVVIIIISVLVAVALPRYFAAIYAGRVRACQSNFKIINTAVQAYFAQNKAWPTEVENMLPPDDPNYVPLGVTNEKAGQLTELPICPFDTDGSMSYDLVPVYENPADTTTPVVGCVTDWNNHWLTASWQSATEHLPSP
jgi:general secretion pathway protein G